jgi:hypothetical protein
LSRHVYVKKNKKTGKYPKVPVPDDIVFIRESLKGRAGAGDVYRRVHGKREPFPIEIPPGKGGIIYEVKVTGNKLREPSDKDVVYDYGDLHEWRVIDCNEPPLPIDPECCTRERVMIAIGKEPDAGPMFLRLWKVPKKYEATLLALISECKAKGR